MKEEDKKRIEEAALSYADKLNIATEGAGYHSYAAKDFKAGVEYEHPIAYEAGFQDGFKKMDNEMYNHAIEDVIAKISITMDPVFGTAVISEIQKLKKP